MVNEIMATFPPLSESPDYTLFRAVDAHGRIEKPAEFLHDGLNVPRVDRQLGRPEVAQAGDLDDDPPE
jgi:hypothetical protein